MSTRKRFVAVAAQIAKIRTVSARKAEAEKFASVFAGENPRFDKARFFAACGL